MPAQLRFSAPLSLTRVSVTEVEDRFSAPLSLTRVSVTRDSSEYSTREEVLAEQLTEQLEVFPPTRELRGGRAEERGEAHREGAEGQRLQEAVLGGQEDEVSEDAGTHIFRSKSPRCNGWQDAAILIVCIIVISRQCSCVPRNIPTKLYLVPIISCPDLSFGVPVADRTPDRKDIIVAKWLDMRMYR